MQNYKKLQDLNLIEVSHRTQIELVFLQALLDKDFKTLNRFNVKGFLKILEREYELDFSDFNEEFEHYLRENEAHLHSDKPTIPPLISYTNKNSVLPLIFGIFVLCIVGLGIYYFDTIKTLLITNAENNVSIVNIEVLKEAEQNLHHLKNSSVIFVDNSEQNLSAKEPILNEQEENLSTSKESLSQESSSQEENLTHNESSTMIEENLKGSEAIFKIKHKIWVGIIELKNFKKTSLVKEADFNVSLAEDKLILAGAAALSVIDEDGRERHYAAGASKRFLIKDGKIASIDAGEFKRLNNGKDW